MFKSILPSNIDYNEALYMLLLDPFLGGLGHLNNPFLERLGLLILKKST